MSTALAAATAMAAASSSAAPAATTVSNTTNTTNTTVVTATASPATNSNTTTTTITTTHTTKSTITAGTLEPAGGIVAESQEYQSVQVAPDQEHSQLISNSAPKPRRQRRTTVVHTCPRPPGGYRYSMEFLYGIGSCMAGTTLNIATPLSITPRSVRTTPPSLTTRMPLLATMGMPASASPRPIDGNLSRNRYAIGVMGTGSPGGGLTTVTTVPASSPTTTSVTATPGSSPGSPASGVLATGSPNSLPSPQFIYQGYLPNGPQRRLWHAENAFWQFDRNYPYNQGYASQYGIPMMPVGFEHPYGSQRIIYPGYYSQPSGPFHAAPVSGMPRVNRHVTQQPHPVAQQPTTVVSGETTEESIPSPSTTWRHVGPPGGQRERLGSGRQASTPQGPMDFHRESKSYYKSVTTGVGGGSRYKAPFDHQASGNARNYLGGGPATVGAASTTAPPVVAAPPASASAAAAAPTPTGSRDQNPSNGNQSRMCQGPGNNPYAKSRNQGKRGNKNMQGKERTSNSSGSLSASSSKSHLERPASSNTSIPPPQKHPNRSYRNRIRYLNANESSERKPMPMGVAVPVSTTFQQQPQPSNMRRVGKFQGPNAYHGNVVESGKPVVNRHQRYYQSRNCDTYVYQPGQYMVYAAGAAPPMGLGGMLHPGQGCPGMAMGVGGGARNAGSSSARGSGGVGGGGAGGAGATATTSSATSEGEQPLDSDFDQRQDYADLGLDPGNGSFSSDLEPLSYKQDTSEMDAHSCLLSHPCSDIEPTDGQSIGSAAISMATSQDSDATESDLSGASVESVVRKVMVGCLAFATGAEVPDLNGPNLVPYGDMHHLMELEFHASITNGYRTAMLHPAHNPMIHQRVHGMSCGDMLSHSAEDMGYKLEKDHHQQQQQKQQEDGNDEGKRRYEETDYISMESNQAVSPSASSSKSAEAPVSARANIIMPKETLEDGLLHHDMHNRYWREFFGYTPADRFLLRTKLVEMKRPPNTVPSSSKWDPLSLSIWRKFLEAQQTRHIYKTKMRLWRFIYTVAMTNYPRYGLYLVGSSISHFGSKFSDMDICMLACTNPNIDPRMEAVYHLQLMRELLSRTNEFQDFNLIEARVPILRFTDCRHKVEVDINFNNSVGIRNTHLLYCYSQLEWRVRPMALAVKQWAQYHDINNAKNMTISSYSLMLMVIHYLQAGASPPVLPCLHKMYPEKFGLLLPSDFGYVDMNEVMGPYPSDNTQSLGDLLVGFLHYYSVFEYGKYAISIRVGGVLPVEVCRASKAPKNDIHQWNELCIEEPFDQTNTARSVYDSTTFERIRAIFQASYRRLESTRSLSSIFEDYDGPTIVMQQPSGDSECDFYEGQQQQQQLHHQQHHRSVFRSNSDFPSPRPFKLMVDKATTAIWTDINMKTEQKEPEEHQSREMGVEDDSVATEPPLA
ncbi:poly(A) RNA polymerase gld-2 homolog A [Drosophila serrata]|uniref:poly(A) RNA polymerase gld-2 homolog A n=1 Tax=Drosophila serrata TaxID=7274 RepID=UPI000A1D3727|nr:poly(A) RNA polymerase gld-2 homolog A [Drosophila serrata]